MLNTYCFVSWQWQPKKKLNWPDAKIPCLRQCIAQVNASIGRKRDANMELGDHCMFIHGDMIEVPVCQPWKQSFYGCERGMCCTFRHPNGTARQYKSFVANANDQSAIQRVLLVPLQKYKPKQKQKQMKKQKQKTQLTPLK